jgi:aspartate/methionine/tyrosine aminotransferase
MSNVSETVASIGLSAIKDMASRAAKREGAVSLAWGLPSFRTPEAIRTATAAALANDVEVGKYTLPDGLPAFRDAAAADHFARTGHEISAEANIISSAGNMEAGKVVLRTLLDPGDEVIVTDPCFASHLLQIKLAGGKAVFWPMNEADGWRADIAGLEGLVTARTKAILLVTPSNPTGTVFPRGDLAAIGRLAERRGLLVIADDPYSRFVYEDADAFCHPASVPELRDRLISLFTFSKCYAMSGWRLGYMVMPDWLKPQVMKVHDATLICPPRISQVAGLAALTHPDDHTAEFRRILSARRDLICERLDRLAHVFSYVRPQGAYYVFPKILLPHHDSYSFALDLLERAGVSTTPGGAFGPHGEHHLRMAYCVEENQINQAFDRLEQVFA